MYQILPYILHIVFCFWHLTELKVLGSSLFRCIIISINELLRIFQGERLDPDPPLILSDPSADPSDPSPKNNNEEYCH